LKKRENRKKKSKIKWKKESSRKREYNFSNKIRN
jgi:hypothetical protein